MYRISNSCGFSRRRFIQGALLGLGFPALAFSGQTGFRTTRGRFSSTLSLKLADLKVTSVGRVITSAQGRLRQGYQIEGAAKSIEPDGSEQTRRLTIVADVFIAAVDFPGQKKGSITLNGQWTLETAPGALPAGSDSFAGKLAGRIKATLPQDPAGGTVPINGVLDVPMTRIYLEPDQPAFRPARGGGSVVLNTDTTGQMVLNLSLWPLFDSSSQNS